MIPNYSMFILNLNVVSQWTFKVQDSSQEQDFPKINLLQRGSRNPEELLKFGEAALAWFSFPLEHLKIREKNTLCEILDQRVPVRLLYSVVQITAGSCSPGNTPPGRNPELKRTRTPAIF
jgi:hypothetical protein